MVIVINDGAVHLMLIEHGCVTDAALSELEADDYAPRRGVPQSVVSPLRDDLAMIRQIYVVALCVCHLLLDAVELKSQILGSNARSARIYSR